MHKDILYWNIIKTLTSESESEKLTLIQIAIIIICEIYGLHIID